MVSREILGRRLTSMKQSLDWAKLGRARQRGQQSVDFPPRRQVMIRIQSGSLTCAPCPLAWSGVRSFVRPTRLAS